MMVTTVPPTAAGLREMVADWSIRSRRHNANPVPVPGYSSRVFKRRKSSKTAWASVGSTSMPLSVTVSTHEVPMTLPVICTVGWAAVL